MNFTDTMCALVALLSVLLLVSLHVHQWQHARFRVMQALVTGRELGQVEAQVAHAHAELGVQRVASTPPDPWKAKAAAFQAEFAAAKERLDAADGPAECVYEECVEAPTASHVDEKGRVTGLCERHARRWLRLDEAGRRAVRTGAAS